MTKNKENLPPLVVILGPTGSGKTSLSLKLAKKYYGEIVSADSRQIYKEMDIGTDKIKITQEPSSSAGRQKKKKSSCWQNL